MTAQVLDRTLTAYRIGDPHGAYRIFDAEGSRLFPGRWNTPASPMIYAREYGGQEYGGQEHHTLTLAAGLPSGARFAPAFITLRPVGDFGEIS